MRCPYCGHQDDRVLDTRIHREGAQIRRRRECLQCKGRYSTAENILEVLPLVIKKDGRRETYSKEKVFKGIQAACQKRPIGLVEIENMVERITAWAMAQHEKEIPAADLGSIVMKELQALDDVAYVRFASVYRTFKDVNEFVTGLTDEPDDPSEHPLSN
ncbi:MAG: transcriptional regulator NrdR [Bdellovibrionales bacterium]